MHAQYFTEYPGNPHADARRLFEELRNRQDDGRTIDAAEIQRAAEITLDHQPPAYRRTVCQMAGTAWQVARGAAFKRPEAEPQERYAVAIGIRSDEPLARFYSHTADSARRLIARLIEYMHAGNIPNRPIHIHDNDNGGIHVATIFPKNCERDLFSGQKLEPRFDAIA